jgi:hypothetical protein
MTVTDPCPGAQGRDFLPGFRRGPPAEALIPPGVHRHRGAGRRSRHCPARNPEFNFFSVLNKYIVEQLFNQMSLNIMD